MVLMCRDDGGVLLSFYRYSAQGAMCPGLHQ